MGVSLVTKEGTEVWNGSRIYMEAYIAVTDAVSDFYHSESPIDARCLSDTYVMDEVLFCQLVEAVMSNPCDLFYVWAQRAMGMYLQIRQPPMQWDWPKREQPIIPFIPITTGI